MLALSANFQSAIISAGIAEGIAVSMNEALFEDTLLKASVEKVKSVANKTIVGVMCLEHDAFFKRKILLFFIGSFFQCGY